MLHCLRKFHQLLADCDQIRCPEIVPSGALFSGPHEEYFEVKGTYSNMDINGLGLPVFLPTPKVNSYRFSAGGCMPSHFEFIFTKDGDRRCRLCLSIDMSPEGDRSIFGKWLKVTSELQDELLLLADHLDVLVEKKIAYDFGNKMKESFSVYEKHAGKKRITQNRLKLELVHNFQHDDENVSCLKEVFDAIVKKLAHVGSDCANVPNFLWYRAETDFTWKLPGRH